MIAPDVKSMASRSVVLPEPPWPDQQDVADVLRVVGLQRASPPGARRRSRRGHASPVATLAPIQMVRFQRQPPAPRSRAAPWWSGGVGTRGGRLGRGRPRGARAGGLARRAPARAAAGRVATARTTAPAARSTGCSASCWTVPGTGWSWARSPGRRATTGPDVAAGGDRRARAPASCPPTCVRAAPRSRYSVEESHVTRGSATRSLTSALAAAGLDWPSGSRPRSASLAVVVRTSQVAKEERA